MQLAQRRNTATQHSVKHRVTGSTAAASRLAALEGMGAKDDLRHATQLKSVAARARA